MYRLDSNEIELKGYDTNPYSNPVSFIPINIISPIIIKVISEHRYVIPKKIDLSKDNMLIEYDIKEYGKIKDQNYLKFLEELPSVIAGISGYKVDFLEELSNEIINYWKLYIGSDKQNDVEELFNFSQSNKITSEYFLLNNSKW